MPVGVKPELLQFRGIFGHPLATQVDPRLTLECRIDLNESIIYWIILSVELHLDDGERRLDRLDNGSETLFTLAQRRFRLASGCQVEHRSDHAQRLAISTAYGMSSIQHFSVGTVTALKTILITPGTAIALSDRMDRIEDSVPVIRMYVLQPPVAGGLRCR